MINLVTSTMPQLKAEFARLADVVAEAEGDRRQIHKEIEKRKAAVTAKALLNTLSPKEIAVLKEQLLP